MQPLPLRHAIDVHWIPSWQLWLPVHTTSHAHEFAHEMLRHDAGPEQPTSHGPGPHITAWHACRPEHSTLHDALCEQLTPLRHEFSTLQRMSHLNPLGHVTMFEQFVFVQSTVQVFSATLHVVQLGGQLFASPWRASAGFAASIEPATMQNPLSQMRPSPQSVFFSHAY